MFSNSCDCSRIDLDDFRKCSSILMLIQFQHIAERQSEVRPLKCLYAGIHALYSIEASEGTQRRLLMGLWCGQMQGNKMYASVVSTD